MPCCAPWGSAGRAWSRCQSLKVRCTAWLRRRLRLRRDRSSASDLRGYFRAEVCCTPARWPPPWADPVPDHFRFDGLFHCNRHPGRARHPLRDLHPELTDADIVGDQEPARAGPTPEAIDMGHRAPWNPGPGIDRRPGDREPFDSDCGRGGPGDPGVRADRPPHLRAIERHRPRKVGHPGHRRLRRRLGLWAEPGRGLEPAPPRDPSRLA